MRACGHDFHIAALIGAAGVLSRMRERIEGNAVFLFQPAEETTSGALALLNDGLAARLPFKIDAVFGLYNRPEITAGKIGVRRGALMAQKSSFEITLHGKSGHGGMPHKCVDVIVAAASAISGIQTIISRKPTAAVRRWRSGTMFPLYTMTRPSMRPP